MNIKFPYQLDHCGHSAKTPNDAHIREMIEQVLFTSPGERINRSTFGSGLVQLVFGPNSSELAATVLFLLQGALQQWTIEITNDPNSKFFIMRVVVLNFMAFSFNLSG